MAGPFGGDALLMDLLTPIIAAVAGAAFGAIVTACLAYWLQQRLAEREAKRSWRTRRALLILPSIARVLTRHVLDAAPADRKRLAAELSELHATLSLLSEDSRLYNLYRHLSDYLQLLRAFYDGEVTRQEAEDARERARAAVKSFYDQV